MFSSLKYYCSSQQFIKIILFILLLLSLSGCDGSNVKTQDVAKNKVVDAKQDVVAEDRSFVNEYVKNRVSDTDRVTLKFTKDIPGPGNDHIYLDDKYVYHERGGNLYKIAGADAKTFEFRNILPIFADKNSVFFLNKDGYFVRSKNIDRATFAFVGDDSGFCAYFVKDKNGVYQSGSKSNLVPIDGADSRTFEVKTAVYGDMGGGETITVFAKDGGNVWFLDRKRELRKIKELDAATFQILNFRTANIYLIDREHVYKFDGETDQYSFVEGLDIEKYIPVYKNVFKNSTGVYYLEPDTLSMRKIEGIDVGSLEFATEKYDKDTYAYLRDKEGVWEYNDQKFLFEKIEGADRSRFGPFNK